MRIKKIPLKKENEIFFSLAIDFDLDYKYQHNYMDVEIEPLQPGGHYRLKGDRLKNEQVTTYEKIVDYIVDIINDDLKLRCQNYYNIPVKEIKVIETYHGSIHVIFTTIFSAFGVISGLKDLYDWIELFRELSRAHIKNKLEERYGVPFRVSIDSIAGKDDNRYHYMDVMDGVPFMHSGRDAFFYYLLISNIILLILIGLLVSKAVLNMYW